MGSVLALGPDDYLVFPAKVHIMRYRGRDELGHRWWRLACGSHLSSEALDSLSYSPTAAEVAEHDLAVCGNCRRTKAADR